MIDMAAEHADVEHVDVVDEAVDNVLLEQLMTIQLN